MNLLYDQLGQADKVRHYGPDTFGGDPTTLADNPLLAEFDYTLRADGKRISETVTGQNGLVGEYDWLYDGAGRLTSESFDHASEISKDYTAGYKFDLAGNRLEKTVDQESNGSVDQRFGYQYDSADRLLEETLDSLSGQDTRTAYDWGTNGSKTYQTSKTVYDPNGGPTPLETTTYGHDLRGRMTQAQKVTSKLRDTTTFQYADNGIRISAIQTLENADGNNGWSSPHSQIKTIYLNDPSNATGYSQVLVETRLDEASNITTQLGYVLGLDLIAQSTSSWDTNTSSFQPPEVITLVYDGHGTTRGWTNVNGSFDSNALNGVLLYDAHGLPLNFDSANAPTNYLYSGEQWDQRVQMQYLRARWYDAMSGAFASIDPYSGDSLDPISFHKYAYSHSDPVNGFDPTGEFFASVGSMFVYASLSQQVLSVGFAALGTYDVFNSVLSAWNVGQCVIDNDWWGVLINSAFSALSAGFAAVNFATALSILKVPPPPAFMMQVAVSSPEAVVKMMVANPAFEMWILRHVVPTVGLQLAAAPIILAAHHMSWQIRDARGRIKTRGNYDSGGTETGDRPSFEQQREVHTERKFIREKGDMVSPGDIVTFKGELPMCKPGRGPYGDRSGCQVHMQWFAKAKKCIVYYADELGRVLKIKPSGELVKPDGSIVPAPTVAPRP